MSPDKETPDDEPTITEGFSESVESDNNRFQVLKGRLQELIRDNDLHMSERDIEGAVFQTLLLPRFLERLKLDREVGRSAQWLAAFLLVFLIPITVNITVAMALVMEGILTAFGDPGEAVFFQFLISGLNLAFIAIAFWFWILWVSTGGFRLLDS